MRRRSAAMEAKLVLLVPTLALAACAAQDVNPETRQQAAAPESAYDGSSVAPGGIVRRGDTFATMAQQYTAHPGPYSATGASAWVEPAPPPVFVVSDPLPPADPPAPPLAAVANRQPAASADAAEVVRPEAAAPEASAAAPDPGLRTAGLALFNNFSCGTCHAMADAGAGGAIGPTLDRNPRLTREYTIDVIANGRGAMPSFGGQMSDEEIATLADYIMQFARK